MTASVRLDHLVATVTNGVWTGEEPVFAEACRVAAIPVPGKLRLYEPDPDYAAATRVVGQLGARLIAHTPETYVEDRVY